MFKNYEEYIRTLIEMIDCLYSDEWLGWSEFYDAVNNDRFMNKEKPIPMKKLKEYMQVLKFHGVVYSEYCRDEDLNLFYGRGWFLNREKKIGSR